MRRRDRLSATQARHPPRVEAPVPRHGVFLKKEAGALLCHLREGSKVFVTRVDITKNKRTQDSLLIYSLIQKGLPLHQTGHIPECHLIFN
jgi:hypothetical protein